MKNFEIENKVSGAYLGVHPGKNAADAIEAMAHGIGATSYREWIHGLNDAFMLTEDDLDGLVEAAIAELVITEV